MARWPGRTKLYPAILDEPDGLVGGEHEHICEQFLPSAGDHDQLDENVLSRFFEFAVAEITFANPIAGSFDEPARMFYRLPVQIVATTLIVLGGLLCVANWLSVLQSILTKKFHSAVPFFGAGLLGGGMLLVPATRHWAWLAILLDYGTLAFIIALPHLIHEAWNTSQFNLLRDYSGKIENKFVRLRLFRRGIFTIRISIQRPPGQSGLTGTGTIGTWSVSDERLKLEIHGGDFALFNVSQMSDSEFLQQQNGFSRFEKDRETSLAGIKLSLDSKTNRPLLGQGASSFI